MNPHTANHELKHLWRQWTSLIQRRLKKGNTGIRSDDYSELHRQMMLTFHAARKTPNNKTLMKLVKLEKLAAPWITEESISQAEPEVLNDLINRCRRVERGWIGYEFSFNPRKWSATVIGVLICLAVFTIVYLLLQENSPMYWLQRLQEIGTDIRFTIARASLLEKISAIVVILVLISIRLLAFKR